MNTLAAMQDTIVAISTPPGSGAIGIIRLSGQHALRITNTLFTSKNLLAQASHTLHFGLLKHPHTSEIIDEVVVSLFLGNKSYTGEDTVEISAHGSSYILEQIINACLLLGARLAMPGEFTQRAFFNGKLDLTQAEAVADLIAAENKSSHDIALQQMRGGISNELGLLREQLIHFTAMIELELDFSDEDVEFADRTALQALMDTLLSTIQQLIDSFEYGNAIKAGVPVAIIGKPNAGKSTLLNALLKEERAIVSDIAGTTRDTIEEAINLGGITFRFIDTAGIRNTADTIEAIGVAKAKDKVAQAAVVLHLFEEDTAILDELAPILTDKKVFNIRTKADIHHHEIPTEIIDKYPTYQHLAISVTTGYNMELLTQHLIELYKPTHTSSTIISNIRHKEALVQAQQALLSVVQGMEMNLTGDLLSLHLKDALYHLGTITGRIDVDKDILGTIFGKFCIGK